MKNLSKLTILAMMSLSLNAWAGEDVTTLVPGEQVTKSESVLSDPIFIESESELTTFPLEEQVTKSEPILIESSVTKIEFVSEKSDSLAFRLTGINFTAAIKYKTDLAGKYNRLFLDSFWPSKNDDIGNLTVVVSKNYSTISLINLSSDIPALIKDFKSRVTIQSGVITLNILEEENMDSYRLIEDYLRPIILPMVAEIETPYIYLLPDHKRFFKFIDTLKANSEYSIKERISAKNFVCEIREDDKKVDSKRMTCSVNLIHIL